MPERATVMSRSEKSAEAVVVAGKGRKAERGEVFAGMSMVNAARQKSARAERPGVAPGEAEGDPVSDEAFGPRRDTESTGPGLLQAVLARENLKRAWKRVKANQGAAGWMVWTLNRPPASLSRHGRRSGISGHGGRTGPGRCDA